jgi:hypothetical protein
MPRETIRGLVSAKARVIHAVALSASPSIVSGQRDLIYDDAQSRPDLVLEKAYPLRIDAYVLDSRRFSCRFRTTQPETHTKNPCARVVSDLPKTKVARESVSIFNPVEFLFWEGEPCV